MTIKITRSQVVNLARSMSRESGSYGQRLDLIASAFGYRNQASMMAALNAGQPAPEKVTDLYSGKISDHRLDGDENAEGALDPVEVLVRRENDYAIDVFIGGAERDYTAIGSSSVRIEREGDVTRFMIYDACCDSPMVLGVPDKAPMSRLEDDWESFPREDLEP